MSLMFQHDGGPGPRKPVKKKKKAAPRKGSVAASLKRINTNVRRAATSAKRAGNIKGSVGASAGARVGSKARPKAQARARVSVYSPAPVRRKAAPVRRKVAAPVRKKAAPVRRKATYSSPGRVTSKRAPVKANSFSGSNLSAQSSQFSSNSAPVIKTPPPPKPPSEKEWLAGDSAYQDQISEYEKALQDFVARIAERESEIKQDADLAIKANQRNQTLGLNSNAEDFASRGMINSGLFADSAEKLSDRYNEARGSIETNRGRQIGAMADERETYKRENELGRNNARRQALQRMALQWGGI